MLSESDKTADHEMSTSDHGPFHCVRFASVRSVTTALSCESGAAIWHRSDRDRKGFDPTFCKTSGCYSAKIRACISHEHGGIRLRDKSVLTRAFLCADGKQTAFLSSKAAIRATSP
jgi:hypothetical protein